MRRLLKKRLLLFVATIGVIGLLGTHFSGLPTNVEENSGREAAIAENEPDAIAAEAADDGAEELADNSPNWFEPYRKDFGPEALELEGKITINYPGYEGKFRLLTLVPSPSAIQVSVPIFLLDEKNPSVNSLGSGTFERTPQERIRFVGNTIQPFFSRKLTPETAGEPGAEPSGIATVMFKFESMASRGTSIVEVNFAFDPSGPPTQVGKMDYSLRAIGSPNL